MTRARSNMPQTAVVLTAGLGTRLRPLTTVRAKPAVPVAGVPLVRRILAGLAAAGVEEAILNLHHRPETIAAVVGDGRDLGLRVRYSWEDPLLGSAGGPRRALELMDDETFFVVNGDTLSETDLQGLAAAHAGTSALVTLALNPGREGYGGVALDAAGRVQRFVPRAQALGPRVYHFVGTQIVRRAAFADLPDGHPCESLTSLYPELLARDADSVRGHVRDVAFWDVGTVADYVDTNLDFTRRAGLSAPPVGRGTVIDPSSQLTNTIAWDDVTVEGGCVLVRCVLTDGVRIPAGTRLRDAVVLPEGLPARGPGD